MKVKAAYEKIRDFEKNRRIRPLSPVSHHPDLRYAVLTANNVVASLGSSVHLPQPVSINI